MCTLEKSNSKSHTTESNIDFIKYVKYEHLIAGLSGGVVATLILHPLDLLKIRFEVNDGFHYDPKYKGIVNGLVTIFKQEGIRGLYRGAAPSTIGAGSAWGLYFYFYNSLKSWQQNGILNNVLTPTQHLVSGFEAGAITLMLTNPIWVCKTRLCLQSSANTPQTEVYKGMIDTLVKLYRTEGIKGWYKGVIPGLFGVSHGAIQFMIYEEMKNYYNKKNNMPITTKLGVPLYLSFAAASKLLAVGVTYPYQVIRVRLQNQFYSYNGMFDCIKHTWKFEGWKGFYKGLGTNLVRVIPATMITFVVYENVSHFLISLQEKS